MANRRIYIDKTEIVFMVPAKKKMARHCLAANDISRIQFDKKETKILGFIKLQEESISVSSGRLGAPIVYKKGQNKKFFDEYKRDLERFAKNNTVTFADNTK